VVHHPRSYVESIILNRTNQFRWRILARLRPAPPVGWAQVCHFELPVDGVTRNCAGNNVRTIRSVRRELPALQLSRACASTGSRPAPTSTRSRVKSDCKASAPPWGPSASSALMWLARVSGTGRSTGRHRQPVQPLPAAQSGVRVETTGPATTQRCTTTRAASSCLERPIGSDRVRPFM
jgi:hypothetical protein